MNRSKLFLLLLIALPLFGAALYFGLRSSQAAGSHGTENGTEPPPAAVEVTRGDVTQTVLAPGQVVNASETYLQARVSGIVEALAVLPCDRVQTGQVVARLGERKQFEAAAAAAQTRVIEAQIELDRLNPAAMLAEAELELLQARKERDQALARLAGRENTRGSQANIEAARVKLILTEKALKDAEEDYLQVDHLADHDIRKAAALSTLASARQERGRALANLQNLEGTPGEVEIEHAETEVAAAEARLQEAQGKVEKLKNGENSDLELADAHLKDAQAALEASLADIDSLEIRAPFEGIVVSVGVKPGEAVIDGTPLLVLIHPNAQEVHATVIEEDLPWWRRGSLRSFISTLFLNRLPRGEYCALSPLEFLKRTARFMKCSCRLILRAQAWFPV